jgi:hypothetical protein
LAKHVGASKEDLEAVEHLAANHERAHHKRSTHDQSKKLSSGAVVLSSNNGKMPNSYNFYGERSSQDSTQQRPLPDPVGQRKTKIVEVIDFGAEDTNPRIERDYFPNSDPESSGPDKMSDGMLRKLIENIHTSFALKN